ncbi:MAG: HAMP domain-containing sensor histidine kinase [Candidatus Gracilibacteria bacterium]|nr:HAMP domain-containing sensor histidine kinase [Candidatus Gracilibacteria bacterium]
MNISKEHKLAIKISLILLFFAFFLAAFFPYYNNIMGNNIGNTGYGMGMGSGYGMGIYNNNKYYLFIILAIIIYFFSYFFAKVTIQPIEENNKKLKEYNHNLAHEIKTPLSVIKSNLELLELNFDKELINSSKEEILYMQEIIDNLLFLSEKTVLNKRENISIKEIVEKYKKENINIEVDGDFIIVGNSILLDTMIKNLVDNALKYTIGDEKIFIKISKNSFEIKNKTSLDLNQVELDKLVDTFYQADNSRSGKGYGLGLSIVKKIAILHNLNIIIKNIDGHFIVVIK